MRKAESQHRRERERREKGLLFGKLFHPKILARSPCPCCHPNPPAQTAHLIAYHPHQGHGLSQAAEQPWRGLVILKPR